MLVRAGVVGLSALLAPAGRRFARSLAAPEETQTQLKAKLARSHAKTAWGREHGVDGTPTSFDRLPVASWPDIAALIEREQAGEALQITPARVRFFEPTSGSGGAHKAVPCSGELLGTFRRLFAIWAHDLLRHGPKLRTGRFYFSLSPPLSSQAAPEDATGAGLDDDADYLAPWLRAALGPFFVRPTLGRGPTDAEVFKDQTALALLACPSLEVISVWSPSFLHVHLDHIAAEGDRLLGALADRGPRGRRRAEELEAALVEPVRAGREPAWAGVWPDLQLVSCWADAGARAGAERLKSRLGPVLVQGKGLLATEAPVTVPLVRLDDAGLGQAPLLDDVLIELEDEAGDVRPLIAAEDGARYRVVVSPRGGLPRYRLGDVVEVRGRAGPTPLLRFVGRADAISDLVGEKLEATFVEDALADAAGGAFATLLPDPGPPARYVLLTDQPGAGPALGREVEDRLSRAHHYRQARLLGQLGPVEVIAAADAEARLLRSWRAAGRREGDLKPVALHRVALPLSPLFGASPPAEEVTS